MGIRVVQRAIAPPSPNLYNAKGMTPHKVALFGCRSTTLESKVLAQSPQNKSRSMEVGLEMSRLKTIDTTMKDEKGELSKSPMQTTSEKSILKERGAGDAKNDENMQQIDDEQEIDIIKEENKTPSHVTFKDKNSTEVDDEKMEEDKEKFEDEENESPAIKNMECMDITSDNEVSGKLYSFLL